MRIDKNKDTMSIRYKNKEWIKGATRNMSFLHQCLCSGYTRTNDFGAPKSSLNVSVTFDGTKTDFLTEVKSLESFSNGLVQMSFDSKKIKALQVKYKNFSKEFLFSLDEMNKNLNIKNFNLFSKQYERFGSGLWLTTVMGRCVFETLREKLTILGYAQDIDDICASITYPQEHTPLSSSRLELLEIGFSDISTPEKLQKQLQKWLVKFGHIPVNFCEEPWSITDAQKQFTDIQKGNPKKTYDAMVANHAEKIKTKKEWLQKINNKEISLLAHALAVCTTINEFRKNVFCRVSLGYRPSFQKIAELSGSNSWRDCFFLTPEEIKKILSGKKLNIKKIKEQRKIVGIISDSKGGLSFMNKKTLNLFLQESSFGKQNKNSQETNLSEVKGTVANKGKVRGTVKVVLSRSEFDKFKKGDILVATMTSVDFVPIMEMAAAFVTNEGGITSHASIVAREMNKPCIIGTKIATKVLKDGDLVEVDANTGIVKILKKAGKK